MKKYLEYKNEIQKLKDVFETVKITEKIAGSYITFLRKEVKNLDSYIKSLERVIVRVLLFCSTENNPFLSQKAHGKNTLVVMTGEKGLVGDLYHNLVGFLLTEAKNYQSFINIGRKGERFLKEENIKIDKSFSDVSEIPQAQEITAITNYIFSEFQSGRIKKIDVLYSRFISLSQHEPQIIQFLPFKFSLSETNFKKESLINENLGFPIFEPSGKKIFDRLFEKYIKIFFYKIIMEARLSEFSARTIATEHAAAKTEKSIKKLIIDYLKERRRITTQKQIESFIVHQTL